MSVSPCPDDVMPHMYPHNAVRVMIEAIMNNFGEKRKATRRIGSFCVQPGGSILAAVSARSM